MFCRLHQRVGLPFPGTEKLGRIPGQVTWHAPITSVLCLVLCVSGRTRGPNTSRTRAQGQVGASWQMRHNSAGWGLGPPGSPEAST